MPMTAPGGDAAAAEATRGAIQADRNAITTHRQTRFTGMLASLLYSGQRYPLGFDQKAGREFNCRDRGSGTSVDVPPADSLSWAGEAACGARILSFGEEWI